MLDSEEADKLFLPDLEACGNKKIAIYSDYSGESSGKYCTYSFLACAWNGTDRFNIEMSKIRNDTGLAREEIAFKYFRRGQMQRALPKYLSLMDSLVPGLLRKRRADPTSQVMATPTRSA